MFNAEMAAMPVGYRFCPTDYEIISYYLTLKMNGHDSLVDDVIGEIDLLKFEPWELPDLARMKSDDQVWYFICRTDYKYPNRKKASMSRMTRSGYWKVTGEKRYIKAKGTKVDIGTKRTLVFYSKDRNSFTKAIRTDWVIHEYQAQTGHPNQGNFVVIKVMNKADELSEHSPQDGGESGIIGTPNVEVCPVAEEDDNDESFRKIIADGFTLDDLLEGANSFGNNDGASTSQIHTNKDELVPVDFVDSLLNVSDSETSQTGELFNEQGQLENQILPSQHHDLQRKEHGVQSDDILFMESLRKINFVGKSKSGFSRQMVSDSEGGFSDSEGDFSDSAFTKMVNEAQKHGADVPRPKQPEKLKVIESVSLSDFVSKETRLRLRSMTPPSSHGQRSPPPKRPEKPKEPQKPIRSLRVTSDTGSTTNVSTSNRRIGGFIRFETPPSSRGQFPPSVYFINVVVGVLLLVCCIWELLVRH